MIREFQKGQIMKILARTLAIIAFLILGAQIVRHAYILWIEPRGSVLDKYDQPLKGSITNAQSLDELVKRYDPIHKEAQQARLQKHNSDNDSRYIDRSEVEPFKSESMLQDAISDWESKTKEVFSLKFYWIVGFLCLALGTVIFRRGNQWLGLTLQIAAFSEFVYWTSPTFLGSSMKEFDRLLAYKLALSVVSLALLLFVIWIQKIFNSEQEPAHN
jgi:hypothetical protein